MPTVRFTNLFKSTSTNQEEESQAFAGSLLEGATSISFTSQDPNATAYSGNNVPGVLKYTLNGTTYSIEGIISRLFKSGSTYEGFYFIVTGPDFVIGSKETDSAYTLVWPGRLSAFPDQTPGTSTVDGTYSTSSDPVDAALNSLLAAQPTLLSITEADADDKIIAGGTVTYTFSFNVDIDAATFTSADIINTGTASATIQTITEVSPGVFEVVVKGNTSGTIQLAIPAGAGIVTPTGYGLDTAKQNTDDSIITVQAANVTVSSPTVNEASPYAVFTVAGTAGQTLNLALATGTAGSADFGSTSFDVSLDGGLTWTAYTGPVTLTGATALVRTTVVNDTISDNGETFTLTATPTGGTAVTGTATIADNGTGDIFKADGSLDPAAVKNDDRPVTVSSPTVNEASPYAVFTVAGTAGQKLDLALATGTAGSADFGSTSFDVSLDGGLTWTAYTGPVTLTGATALVRTTVVNDTISDNGETFTLTATPTGGTAVTGTATIADNGTGDIFKADGSLDPAAVKNDDRAVTVSSPTVNEASPYAVFTVAGTAGQKLDLALATGTADAADFGSTAFEVSLDGGATWTTYSAPVTLTSATALVRTTIVNDTVSDNGETFTLTATPAGGTAATGTATILDNGTGDIFKADGSLDPAATKNNDGGIGVSSPTVNEASPYAVFTVAGAAGQTLDLSLATGTAGSADFGSTAFDVSLDGGLTWTAYSAPVTLTSATALVRTTITNDTVSDNAETFTLTASATGGSAATGTATIMDNGTGDIFKADGSLDPAAVKNDDRPVTVSSPTVNEASPYAVFTVGGTAGQKLDLSLATGTAGSADFGSTAFDVSLDGGATWSPYTGPVTLTEAAALVRTTVVNDTISDNGETFTLTATPAGGTAATGTATILDNGTGDIFKADGSLDPAAEKNNDGGVGVSSPTVNEASPYAVFTVSGASGLTLDLALATGTAGPADFGSTAFDVSLDGGATWSPYTGPVTLTGTTALVRTTVTNDTIPDNGETFTLTATPTGGTAATGTATIMDNGTGTIFKADGSLDPAAVKNDDRPVTVSSPTVNEASPYAVFTVGGAAGQKLDLALATGTADSADFGSTAFEVSLDGGATWSAYTAPVTLSGTAALVRTTITNDTVPDNGEAFTLTATPAGGTAATGTATILDNGTGDIFKANGSLDPAAPKNNDTPLTVSSPTVNEASPYAVFTVAGAAGQALDLAIATGTAGSADFGSTAFDISLDGGLTWNAYTGPVTLTGATALVRTTVINDTVSDNAETFTLTAAAAGGTPATGTATIMDNGTGDIFKADGSLDPAAVKNDDRPVTVSAPTVNEASPYAPFTVTGTAGQTLSLSLATGTASSADFGSTAFDVSLDGGLTWTAYTAPVTLTGATALVRTTVTNDTISDNAETFTLTAAATGGAPATGTATIMDNGTGDIFKADGSLDPAAVKNDDRPVTVSSPTVNEASPYAVFTIAGTAGQSVNLALATGTAGPRDFGSTRFEVSLDGGATWAAYTGTVTLAGATALARTTILNDTLLDGGETFTLSATAPGGLPGVGTATILDNGTGTIFNANGTENLTAPKNDDSITPIYSVLLANGDRYYSKNAVDAAKMAEGTGNVFEGARFDNLTAAQGGVHRDAYYQAITKDWYFTTSQSLTPYACYVLQPPKSGFEVANVGTAGTTAFHMYINSKGVTQIVSQAEAAALGLAGLGYADKGAVFASSTKTAFSFDAEAYLVANKDDAAIQSFVRSLTSTYTSTSAKPFIEAVEQHFLLQGVAAGLQHGTSATAADLNLAFGTNFIA